MLRSKYRGMPVVAVCTTIVGVLAIRAIAHTQQSELSSFAPVQITESFESVMDGRRGGSRHSTIRILLEERLRARKSAFLI